MRIGRALLLAPSLTLAALGMGSFCDEGPCCETDADCGDGLICWEESCTYWCGSDDDCLADELCYHGEGMRPGEGVCMEPDGSFREASCRERDPPVLDAGPIPYCPIDRFEPNDDVDNATTEWEDAGGLSLCEGDIDVFELALEPGDLATVRVDFEHDDGDVDMELLDDAGTLLNQSASTNDFEILAFGGPAAATYYVRVYGYQGASNRYSIRFEIDPGMPACVDDVYEQNDTRDEATVNPPAQLIGRVCPMDEDWYALEVTTPLPLQIQLVFEHADGDLDMRLWDVFGEIVADSTTLDDNEFIQFEPPFPDFYYLQVYGFFDDWNDYTLIWTNQDEGVCGDGFLDVGEECDDGNTFPGDGCSATCQLEAVCGDGVIEFPEGCDDGNTVSGDGCSSDCEIEIVGCGDGVIEFPEECDDGNTVSGDGCSSACQLEIPAAWTCPDSYYGMGSCDCGCGAVDPDCGGNTADLCIYNNCPGDADPVPDENWLCQLDDCGDGIIQPPEQCDDGNQVSGDGCSAGCTLEVPANWSCPDFYWDDGACDCGCTAQDIDCPNLSAGECDFINCDSGAVVPDDNRVCTDEAVCGDGVIEGNEQCDDGNTSSGDGCSGTCQLEIGPVCGNGVIETGEQCDDGNTSSGDGCSGTCQLEIGPVCGNGVIEFPEQCDDGNTVSGDGCSFVCTLEAQCGNGVIEPPEQCDDGNTNNGDGCSSLCFLELPGCGNGIIEFPEQCDDGNLVDGDGCSSVCTLEGFPVCGNGVIEPPFEECDDGNTFPGDGCNEFCQEEAPADWTCFTGYYGDGVCDCGCTVQDSDCPTLSADECQFNNCPGGVPVLDDDNRICALAGCGNGVIEFPEECDDGNTNSGDGCSPNCTIEPSCGNGVIEFPEQCDDGNQIDGDGCSSFCAIETACGNGIIEPPFEECDDGNLISGDGCSAICQLEGIPQCGNGVVEFPEQCDDGNANGGDGCSAFCTLEPPLEWQCPIFWYGDGICDCGCAVQDTDCPTLSADACGFNNCPGGAPPLEDDNRFCDLPGCGDGMLVPPEECDDGNLVGGDGCNTNCQLEPTCGNGVIEEPEQCDDGNTQSGDGCSETCAIETICGNGIVEFPEQCDDGNNLPGDGCDQNCNFEFPECGDGIVQAPFEECDDGNFEPGDGCDAFCQLEVPVEWTCFAGFFNSGGGCDCGCGALDPDCESPSSAFCDYNQCPDGADVNDDQNWLCELPGCGNGVLDEGEECDDGNNQGGDGCNGNCQLEPTCGNGEVEAGEQCDDGNTIGGDGCSATCQAEIPPEWECPQGWYGDNICDCGCGAFDINDCETNFGTDVCEFDNCNAPEEVDPTNNALCTVPSCPDDFFEPNDTPMDPTDIEPGALTNAVLCEDNDDVFRYDAPAGSFVTVTLQYTAPPGMTLEVGQPGQGVIDEISTGTGVEVLSFESSGSNVGFARVTGESIGPSTPRPYALTVEVEESGCEDDEHEPNNGPLQTTDLEFPAFAEGTICQGDVDFFEFNPPNGVSQIEVFLGADSDDMSITMFRISDFTFFDPVPANTPTIIDLETTNSASITAVVALPAGESEYFFEVFGF